MAVQRLLLDDDSTIALCPRHRKIVADRIVFVEGKVQGGNWKCRVCTVNNRLDGGLVEPQSTLVGRYLVTRYPDGVTYCECMAWRFQRGVPPAKRSCKHIREIADDNH